MKKNLINTQSIVTRSESFNAYVRSINKSVPLAEGEEKSLLLLIAKGGRAAQKAKERLVCSCLLLTVSIAIHYNTRFGKCTELDDLVEQGNEGLIHAAMHYCDGEHGGDGKFCTYAREWIRGYILNYINDYCLLHVKVPGNKQRLMLKYRRLDDEMMAKECRHATVGEFCEKAHIRHDAAAAIMAAYERPVKMDECIDLEDEDGCTRGDMIAGDLNADGALYDSELDAVIRTVIKSCMSPSCAEVTMRIFGIGQVCERQQTYAEIANDMGKSIEWVRIVNLKNIKVISPRLEKYLVA